MEIEAKTDSALVSAQAVLENDIERRVRLTRILCGIAALFLGFIGILFTTTLIVSAPVISLDTYIHHLDAINDIQDLRDHTT